MEGVSCSFTKQSLTSLMRHNEGTVTLATFLHIFVICDQHFSLMKLLVTRIPIEMTGFLPVKICQTMNLSFGVQICLISSLQMYLQVCCVFGK